MMQQGNGAIVKSVCEGGAVQTLCGQNEAP
jgi:hypothetical protein